MPVERNERNGRNRHFKDCYFVYAFLRSFYFCFKQNGLLVPFAPVVDGLFGGKFLPAHPEDILKSGNFHGARIPFLTGVTKDEVSIWFQTGTCHHLLYLEMKTFEIKKDVQKVLNIFYLEGSEMNIEDMRALMRKRAEELLRSKGVPDATQAVVLHAIFAQYLNKRGMMSDTGKGKTMAVVDVSDSQFDCLHSTRMPFLLQLIVFKRVFSIVS